MANTDLGWMYPPKVRKPHYFTDGQSASLCGKWSPLGYLNWQQKWVNPMHLCSPCAVAVDKRERADAQA